MGHRYINRPDGSGVFTDSVSGKQYEHTGGKTGPSSKTAAKQAMLADQAVVRRTADARPKEEKPWYPRNVENIITKSRSERAGRSTAYRTAPRG